jgi:hypothetical protein
MKKTFLELMQDQVVKEHRKRNISERKRIWRVMKSNKLLFVFSLFFILALAAIVIVVAKYTSI